MCVWQSQAPGGIPKSTGVAGCEGAANADPARASAPAAITPSNTSRRVVMAISPWARQRAAKAHLAPVRGGPPSGAADGCVPAVRDLHPRLLQGARTVDSE